MTNLISSMGYVALAVADPGASARDLAGLLGLRNAESAAGRARVTSNARRVEIDYRVGPRTGVIAVGLEVADGAAVDEIARRARADGIGILDDRPLVDGVDRAVRIATPFGPVLELHTPVPRGGGVTAPGLLRLDHVNLRASDPEGMHDLLTDLLGMEMSDRTGGFERAWYRAADGFHHTLAVGPGRGIHHYSFQSQDTGAIVALADRLAGTERSLVWGPGRHGPGNNVFSYFADLDGTVCELCCDMERFDSGNPRPARIWEMDDGRTMNQWGAPPPPDYGPMLTDFVPAPA